MPLWRYCLVFSHLVHIWKFVTYTCAHTVFPHYHCHGVPMLPGHYGLGAWMCIKSSEVLGWYDVFPWIISSYLFCPLGSAYFLTCSQWNSKPVFLEFVLWTAGWQGDCLAAQWCLPPWMFSQLYFTSGPYSSPPNTNTTGPCFTASARALSYASSLHLLPSPFSLWSYFYSFSWGCFL